MSVKIIQGEDRLLTVLLKNSNSSAYDLTGATEVAACFINKDDENSPIQKNLASGVTIVGSADCGKITIKLEETDTVLLEEGVQGFTVTVTEASGDLRKINLPNTINVEAPIC